MDKRSQKFFIYFIFYALVSLHLVKQIITFRLFKAKQLNASEDDLRLASKFNNVVDCEVGGVCLCLLKLFFLNFFYFSHAFLGNYANLWYGDHVNKHS